MMTSTLRRLALGCALAFAAGAVGASQIMGTGIGATNHPTVSGTSSQPTTKGAAAAPGKGAKSADKAASGARK
jgi:hypothetical protein